VEFSDIVTFIKDNWAVIVAVILVVSPICWTILHFLFKNRLEELNAKNENLQLQLDTNESSIDIDDEKKEKNGISGEKIETSEESKKADKRIEKETVEDLNETDAMTSAFDAFRNGEYDKGLDLLKEESENGNDSKRVDMIAFGQYTAFSHGATEAFKDLKQLAEENSDNYHIAVWLALSYEFIQEENKAIELLEEHISKIQDESAIVTLTLHICNFLNNLSKDEEALKRLKKVYRILTLPEEKARVLKRIGAYYEKDEDYDKAFQFYERALMHNPTDTDLRFDVAYLYSNKSAPKFALFHYKKLLGIEGNEMALNNAGVAFGNLSLPILSTTYYKKAAEQNNTLASANLAYKLLDVGFKKEAVDILTPASNKEDVHQNIYSALANISERESEENKKVDKILKDVDFIRKWRHEYGNALLNELKKPEEISGIYDGKPGKLKIEVNDDKEISGQLFLKNIEKPAEFTGSIEGSAIKFKWKEPPKKEPENRKKNLTGLAAALDFPPPPRNESGILIYKNGKLTGYSRSGEKSLDPTTSIYSTNWELERKE